jgi:phosphatidylinositol alpha-mannosyltransferase
MTPLRLALIQRFLPSRSRGGAGHFTHGLANALVARGHQVTVFSADPPPDDARYRVVRLDPPGGRLAPLTFPLTVARQDFSRFDLVHAQGDEQWLPRRGTPPVVRTLHGSSLAEAIHNGLGRRSPKHLALHLYFYAGELLATMRAEAVVAVSASVRSHYPRLDRVIPNGVDIERFASGGGDKSPGPSILFVGELASRKRGLWLIDRFLREVRPALPEAELWLVSPDPAEGPGLRWWGWVEPSQLVSLYQRAWVLCLPSSYEGFGRPYVEAMAAGTPVVASPNPGAREVLDEGRYGWIVPDEALGPALCRLLGDADLRAELAQRGQLRARRYAWPVVAEAYEQVYDSVLARRRVARR